MTPNRWTHALETGAFSPPEGRVLVHGARADEGYSAFGQDLHLVTPLYPDHAALEARGLDVGAEPSGRGYHTALVQIVKSKPRTLGMVAQAFDALEPDGCLIVDGQKNEGIESILKAVRAEMPVVDALSKSHGKLFWARKGDADLSHWVSPAPEAAPGYVTAPGIFSADGPDPGSELLIALVPQLKGRVADFGSGWGYMSGEMLKEHAGIDEMHLIEADYAAHVAGRENVRDPRAAHIWGDVLAEQPEPFDAIISNPPFHTGRQADPDLGRAFIAAAARSLTQRGKFYMVANRHLPYEAALKAAFGTGRMLAEIHGYKLYEAAKPKGTRGAIRR